MRLNISIALLLLLFTKTSIANEKSENNLLSCFNTGSPAPSLWLVTIEEEIVVMETGDNISNTYDRHYIFDNPSYTSITELDETSHRHNRLVIQKLGETYFAITHLGAVFRHEALTVVFDNRYLCQKGIHSIEEMSKTFNDFADKRLSPN